MNTKMKFDTTSSSVVIRAANKRHNGAWAGQGAPPAAL